MSLIAQKISGCYRRVLLFLFIILIVGIGAGAIVYNVIGGTEGLRYWMASRAVAGTEKLIIGNRPDGIARETVEIQFEKVYEAIDSRSIDLKALYDLLKSYQEDFNNPGLTPKEKEENKPSTSEVEEFLQNLEGTILSSGNDK